MAGAADSYVAPAAAIREAFGELYADELVFLAQQCLELGASDHALALCDALAGEDATPGIVLCRAVAQFLAGDRETALAAVDRLLELPRRPLSALGVKAEMLLRAGDRDGARATLLELVERYPDYPRALGRAGHVVSAGAALSGSAGAGPSAAAAALLSRDRC